MPIGERLRSDPYAQATLAYLAYAVAYLGSAIVALSPERRTTHFGIVPWWAFYVMGAVFLLVLPLIPWKRWRWATLLLALGPLVKAAVVGRRLVEGEVTAGAVRATQGVLAVLAAVAAILLLRAVVLDRRLSSGTPSPPASPLPTR